MCPNSKSSFVAVSHDSSLKSPIANFVFNNGKKRLRSLLKEMNSQLYCRMQVYARKQLINNSKTKMPEMKDAELPSKVIFECLAQELSVAEDLEVLGSMTVI